MMNIEALTYRVCKIAETTGEFLKSEILKLKKDDIEIKGVHNFVTHLDRESENRIVENLSELIPGCGFIAEENDSLEPGEYTWIIDPLDGTTNFIHGVPLYSISIGLFHQNEIIIGVVYEPNLREMFYTWQGVHSFLNNRIINVSQTQTIADALFATGFPYYDYNRLDQYLAIFRHLLKNSHGARRLGSAAVDLAYLACGRYDGFYEYGLSPWDVCAGSLLVQNAGGVVSDFHGRNNYLFGKQIIAANHHLYNEFLAVFSSWDSNPLS